MPIYRYPENKLLFFLLSGLLVLCIFNLPARGETLQLAVGETLTISRSLPSTFHSWELNNFEGNYFKFEEESDFLEGSVRYKFKAVEAGTENFQIRRVRRSSFTEEIEDTEAVSLVAHIPDEPGGKEVAEEQEVSTEEKNQAGKEDSSESPGENIDYEVLAEVNELLDLERFEPAREIINEQLNKTGNKQLKKQWLDKLAESYFRAEEYEEAIETREEMIDQFPEESPAGWLYQIARAYRENNEPDEAELSLMRIRHRYRNASRWPDAMQQLAEIAIERKNYQRAANLLKELENKYEKPVPGEILFQLARLYDQFEPVRDYEQAVDYYQLAARRLRNDNPDLSEEAADRASYLMDNYVEFGM